MQKICVFLLLCGMVFGEEYHQYVDFGGVPSGTVAGCVNVITGDLTINQDDLVVRGHEPIRIQRRYFSQYDLFDRYVGWECGFNHLIAKASAKSEGSGYLFLSIPEKMGIEVKYVVNREKAEEKLFKGKRAFFKLDKKAGKLTNVSLGELSARNNPLNNVVHYKPGDIKEIIVEGADGVKRCYRTKESIYTLYHSCGDWEYYLYHEIFPNGNVMHYSWEKDGERRRLTKVKSCSPSGKVFAWVTFSYPDDRQKVLETSDGRTLKYTYQVLKHNNIKLWLLSTVECSSKPKETYSSYWGAEPFGAYLANIHLPEGRHRKLERFQIGWNEEANVHIKKKDVRENPLYKRIRKILDPVGLDDSLQITYRFEYCPGEYEKYGGVTKVYDACGNFTNYHYDKNFWLTSIRSHSHGGGLLSVESYDWNMNGWIRSKSVSGGDGIPLIARQYQYDRSGNVTLEEFWGNHTGAVPGKLAYRGSTVISNGSEGYHLSREYNEKNLLVKEIFPSEKIIEYFYYGATNLLYLTKVSYPDGFSQRQFCLYEDSICIQEIVDDGKGTDINDLSGVTERKIKVIVPKQGTFYGFPERIKEGFFDLEKRCVVILHEQAISYNAKGLVEKISHYDADGKFRYLLEYFYDEKDRLVAQTDPLGRRRIVQYDANGNTVIDDEPNENYRVCTQYDYSNRPVSMTRISEDGKSQRTASGYNRLGQRVSEVDCQGNTTHYAFDSQGHQLEIDFPPIYNDRGEEQISVVKKEYNALGQVELEVDAEGNKTHYFHTSRGKPYQIVHPDGTHEKFTYFLGGALEKHVSPEGIETRYTYDAHERITSKTIIKNGEVLSEEHFTYNTFHLIQKTAPDGTVTVFEYDGTGRKILEETGGRATTFSYDALGRLKTTTRKIDEEHSQVFLIRYDLLDRIVEERELDGKGKLFGYTVYHYDDFSNKAAVAKEVHIGESTAHYKYDSFRRIVLFRDAEGNETTTEYDDHYRNRWGQSVIQKKVCDPRGNLTVETLDALGNLATLERYSGSERLLLRESYHYDLNGNKIKQISELVDSDKTIIKTWKYDCRGRLIELTESGGRTTQFEYTPDGHLKKVQKSDGTVVSYEYDGLGRKVGVKTSDGTCHYLLKYDRMGHVIESIDQISGEKTVREYNHFGELLSETLANGFTLRNQYDDLGRRTLWTLPDLSCVEYVFDAYHLIGVSRLDKEGQKKYAHHYTQYDLSHHLLRESFLGAIGTLEYEVDRLGRRVVADSIYSMEHIRCFDPNGNVLEYLRSCGESEELTEYQYDDLNQIIHEAGETNFEYTYDAHHNRLSKNTDEYCVDILHQLKSAGNITYNHDANGNRIESVRKDKPIQYTYDGLDRLTQIRSGDKAMRLTYDSWGRCLSRVYLTLSDGEWHASSPEDFLFDDQNEVGCFPEQLRILGQGRGAEIGAAIALELDQKVYCPIHDLFGNVIAVIDVNGNLIESYRFSSFGEEKRSENTLNNPWRFQSKRKMAGLIHFGRRFYDPETGRWISPDPKGYDEGPNLYQYVRNNPLIYFDLYGLSAESGTQYSASRFVKDVGYVYFHSWRTTTEAIATGQIRNMSIGVNFLKAVGHVISGERPNPDISHSKMYTLPGKIHPDVDFYFINGILNSKEDALAAGHVVQDLLHGYQVNVLHNSSHGALDLFDFAIEKLGFSTNVCLQLYNRLKTSLDNGKLIVMQIHSEGHSITKRALSWLSTEERNRIRLFGYASVDIFDRESAGFVENNISKRDFVSMGANPFNCMNASMFNYDHVHFLAPATMNPFNEHAFMGQTIQDRVQTVNKDLRSDFNLE